MVKENGPWNVDDWPGGELVLQSDDFTHDVALIVTGDFETPEQKREYAEEIARRLNGTKPVPNAIELTGSPLAASPATGGSDVE